MSAFDAEVGSVWALESDDDIAELARQHGLVIQDDTSVFVVLEGHEKGSDLNADRVFRRAYCLLRDKHTRFTADSFLNRYSTRLA